MASQGNNAKDWKIEVLTASHNGDNESELERIRKSHPDEPECVVDRRVLGALAPTRCTFHLFYPPKTKKELTARPFSLFQ
jgi:pyruvate dehydrogenase phosphatase